MNRPKTRRSGKRQVFFRKILDGRIQEPAQYRTVGSGDVILSVKAVPRSYKFFYQPLHGRVKSLGTALTRDLSSGKIGGFTGVYIGMSATGNGQTNSVPADFNWFEYRATKNQ